MTLTILADDLTGACDTGALFCGRHAVPVTVWPDQPGSGDVRVIDTESRALDGITARARVASTAIRATAARYFKKIDSTLRGAVGAEVEGLLAATRAPVALVCPAFPAQARVVRDRVLLVDGQPVTDTVLARDPRFPATANTGGSVVKLLRPQLDRPIAWIPLREVRAGRPMLSARIARLAGTVAVADAETEGDLDALAEAAVCLDPAPVLVGSAGLGRALAKQLGLLGAPVPAPGGRWLIVVGSLHPASRRQAERARLSGVRVIASSDVRDDDRRRVAETLAAEAVRALDTDAIDVVAVTGGDTAVALLRALDADGVDLVGPPAPGLALARVRSRRRGQLPWLVTKAGGFGGPDLLASLAIQIAA